MIHGFHDSRSVLTGILQIIEKSRRLDLEFYNDRGK